MKTLNQNKTLKSFIAFYGKHPELRFWQSLAAWAKVSKIYIEEYDYEIDDEKLTDTFFLKEKGNDN